MSIIDQIGEVEDKLQVIRKDAEDKVSELNNNAKQKKELMREHYVDELDKESKQLEQDMLARVDEYSKNKRDSTPNIKDQLEKIYRQKRESILKQISDDFWR